MNKLIYNQNQDIEDKTYSDMDIDSTGDGFRHVNGSTWKQIIDMCEAQENDNEMIAIPYPVLLEARQTISELEKECRKWKQATQDLEGAYQLEKEAGECLECQVTLLEKQLAELRKELKMKDEFENWLLHDADAFIENYGTFENK